MINKVGREISKKHWALMDKHAEERSMLLGLAYKRWQDETEELYQECLEKTGHKFVVTPNRSRKLNGELVEWCEYCRKSK